MTSDRPTSIEDYKKALEHDSQEHREAFEQELSTLLTKAKKVATSALLIGGSFAITYYMIKKNFGDKKEVKAEVNGPEKVKEVIIQKKSTISSKIKNLILTEIAMFLLAIAKEKLIAYLEKQKAPENEPAKNA